MTLTLNESERYSFHMYDQSGNYMLNISECHESCVDEDAAIRHAKRMFKKYSTPDRLVSRVMVTLTKYASKSPEVFTVTNEGTVERNKLKVIKFSSKEQTK